MANYGLSINENYIALKCYSDNKIYSYPFYICKNKNADEFVIGEEAYKLRLQGEGIGVDKILNLALKNTIATLYDKTYEAFDLLKEYFRLILKQFTDINYLCIASYDNSIYTLNYLYKVFHELKDYVPNYKICTYEEALSYYSMFQKDQNNFAFIELDEKRLVLYDALFKKYNSQDILFVKKCDTGELFSLDILEEEAGRKIVDKILLKFAEKNIEGKHYSHIFLIGEGFENKDHYKNFMNYICMKNKVRDDVYALVIGAANKAEDASDNDKKASKYRIFNDSRLFSTIYFPAKENGEDTEYVVIRAGSEWFKKVVKVYVILDNTREIKIQIQSVTKKEPRSLVFPIPVDPMRPNKATRVLLKFTFSESNKIDFEIKDVGFGEFYKPTNKINSCEITL